MYTAPLPLAETAAALRTGELDLLAHVEAVCDRIDAAEPHVQAFVPELGRRQRLRAEAAELLARFPDSSRRPGLFGVLVGVKDIFRVDGFPTQAGSQLSADLFAGPEAAVITRLRQAGALIAGKTVTTEFAYFQPGPTRNPHNPGHTPGGSSSGSAAGVAAGFFPLALGTQTIGSVIRPAAFCGVIGYKPSFDRIPTPGLLYFSQSLDHVGLFSQDVAGMALAAAALADDWDSSVAAPPRLPVLAVPDGPYLDEAEEAGQAHFRATLQRLEADGFGIRRIPFFPNFAELNRRHRLLMAAEAARIHDDWYAQFPERYSQHMHQIMQSGQAVSPQEIAAIQAEQADLRQSLADALADADADLWIAPAAPGPAPEGIHATGNPIMNLPWTNAGVPALSIPAGKSRDGLPLAVQFCAAFGQDEQLLAWAQAIEKRVRGEKSGEKR